jgi:hypothetical protein
LRQIPFLWVNSTHQQKNMKKHPLKTLVASLALLVASASALAAPQWCQTKVSNLFVYSDGGVLAQLAIRNDYVQFCNVNTDWKGVGPMACLSWVSLLRSAVSRNADVLVNYADIPSCDTLAIYASAPAPIYIMLKN